jgi:hypothetical protein
MNIEEPRGALTKYAQELERLKVAMDLAYGVGTTNNPSLPEDRVVFPLGVAARDLFEDVHFLVYHARGHTALRTSRTLYECVVFACYIHKHPETWADYLETMYASWANVLRNVSGADQSLPEMHRILSQKYPKYVQGKHVPLDWNDDRTTYDMASAVGVSDDFHAHAFGYTSAYVHPSASFFLRRMTKPDEEEKFVVGVSPNDKSWRESLRISHDLMITALRLRTKYNASPELRTALDVCEKDFLGIWGYVPQSSTANIS